MNARIDLAEAAATQPYFADTHALSNLSTELCNYNMYTQDVALQEAVQREGGSLGSRRS
jgi:putative acyl-CoA dehydrogenase